jgi:predicted nucleic acid-binding protein
LGLIVDTNALSAILDGEPTIAAVFEGADVLAIPVITLGEYRFGISQSTRRAEHEKSLSETCHSTKYYPSLKRPASITRSYVLL